MSDTNNFLYHAPCDSCGSRDNVAVYDDGHTYCFGCGSRKKEVSIRPSMTRAISMEFVKGELRALEKRHIDLDTVQKFNYRIGKHNGKAVHIAPYYNSENKLVAQKLRYADKTFQWIGDIRKAGLFGQHLWRDKGKMCVVVEGEIDCLSYSRANQNRFPVVSVKSGINGAKRDIAKELEWLESFESVVLMFDQDEQGKKGAFECAKLFSPNKAKLCTLPLKDANEMLCAGKVKALIDCVFSSKPYRPDGIVQGVDLWDEIKKEETYVTASYPFKQLNIKTHGLRKGELVTLCAGSGVGKSSFCRHIALYLLRHDFKVGYIALEESIRRSALGIMEVFMKRPLYLTRDGVTEKKLWEVFNDTVGNGNFYLYNHFGSTVADNLLSKIRYLAKACQVDFVILDHLHMALSALGDEKTNDERKLIDYTVAKLRTLVEETGIGLLLVSDLKRPEGNKGYEDGVSVSMNSLRGSQSIGQLSDLIISMNRDISCDKNITEINILKNRFSGETGHAGTLYYNLETSCLSEISDKDVRHEFKTKTNND